MDNNFGVDDSAGKLQTLEKIKNLIENGQSESFRMYIARNSMPSESELDKLCRSYRRTWEENELYAGKNTPETDLIIWSEEESEMYLATFPSREAVDEMYRSMFKD
jgi:hypothetical protein